MATNEYLVKNVLNKHIAITILVTLTATLSMVINGLVVGRMLGADAMVAFGLGAPMFILLGAIAGIFSNGGSIRCATYIGANDADGVRKNFTVSITSSFLTGLFFTVVCLLFSDSLAQIFGASDDIRHMLSDYIRGIGISAIPFLILQNLLQYLRMDNNQRLSLISMVAVVALNSIMAVYFAGCTDLGLLGIGLSIFVGYTVGLVIALTHFRRKKRFLRFGKAPGWKTEFKNICYAGMPTAINRGSQTIKNFVLNSFLLGFAGTTAVLALSVQTNVYQFLIAISTGYGVMVAMMCGMFFGEKDRTAIAATLRTAIKSGVIVSTIAGLVLFIFAEPIAMMFIKDGGDLQLAATCLRFFALSQPTSTVCLIFLYMYQCMKNLLMSNVISLTRGAIYVILVSLCLAPLFGLNMVWLSFFLADLLSILTIMVFVRTKTGKFPRRLEDFIIARDEDFDFKEICNISIPNRMDDVMKISGDIENICLKNGVDKDKSARVALCIEEMAGNVVEHGFDDKKEHFIDIRILIKGDDLIFRMRDDGKMFNPLTETSNSHLGIRTVRATSKNIDYRYSVHLNNIKVTI